MLVVLLTHPGDRNLAVPLCDHIRFLGCVSKHECLIVSPQGTELRGIQDVLAEAFFKTYIYQYPATMTGWPYGPNEAAAEAMMHVWTNPALLYHYLMLEPDCVPKDKHWLDYIDSEYRRSAVPMLGVRINTVAIGTNQVVGRHTVGVAVYPKEFPRLCPLVKNLVAMTREYHRQKAMPAPWDAYFGPYTQKMTADTALIQHLAQVRKVEPDGRVWFDCHSLENALSQVRAEAVLIHGSKDPKFLAALTGRKTDAAQERESTRPVEHPRNAQVQELRQSVEPSRESGSGQNGSGSRDERQSEKPLTAAEQRKKKRAYAKAMKLRKQHGFAAMPDTPEFARSVYFATEMPWGVFLSHASELGVPGIRKTGSKAKMIDAVISVEKGQRKEEWTKDLTREPADNVEAGVWPDGMGNTVRDGVPEIPVEQAPPVPIGSMPVSPGVKTTVQWKEVDKNGNPIYDASEGNGLTEMQKKMLALRAARGLSAA